MNNGAKVLLLILIIAYLVSPVDVVVGPIDDAIVALIGLTALKKSDE